MHDDNAPTISADQEEWANVWERTRNQLLEQVRYIPAMKPDEVKQLIEAMRDAQWGHFQALTMDKRVQLEHTRLFAD